MSAPTEDMGEKIARLLSSPEGMAKIRSAMAAFGGEMPDLPGTAPAAAAPPASPPAAPASPPAAPASPPAAPAPSTVAPPHRESPADGGLPDAAALTRLLPLLGSLNKDDDDTRLLQALRPYLHGEREQRLDEAVKLLRLSHLLPLLQTQGILGGKPPEGGGAAHG